MSSEARSFDVAVIGGGLLGCFAARNLCRTSLSVALIEAREDVCTGISRAGTAIIYPGYDHKPGTLKAAMTVEANRDMDALCRDLDVPFKRCGALMVSFGARADAVLREKLRRGIDNAVPGLQLLTGPEARSLEPALAEDVQSALYSPSSGTLDPWALGIAACENARANGARVFLNTRVLALRRESAGYRILTDRGEYRCRGLVNCAGAEADRLQALLFPPRTHIVTDAGDYLILDRAAEGLPRHILQLEPEDGSKGIAAVPTVGGSLLLGPSQREQRVPYAADPAGLRFVAEQARRLLPGFRAESVIRSFAACRPNPQRPDGSSIGSFVIEHPAPAFWSLIGIKTPGLTCADVLGRHVAKRLAAELHAGENPHFDPRRRGIPRVRELAPAQRAALVRADPDCGEILCLCEEITKSDVLAAIRRGAVTVDGVKRRTGAGMGRCQGSRCAQAIAALLAQELGTGVSDVKKDGPDSFWLGGHHEEL